ncbi:MAG: DNA replication/repair protein RecF [Deltaproteobacteria bacterium]|nr:MAG: DNA replication/repair protein RecF [Deltaproteobacteria bacterium]
MRLLSIQALNFRNLKPLAIDTDAAFVVIHGPNAQGKTNVLEAVYLLATLKPLRARRLQELVRFEEQNAVVGASIRTEGMERRYKVSIGPDGRTVQLDGQKVGLDQWFQGVRAIAFTPSDGEIVLGGPSERRTWLDRAAFTKAPAHLEVVRRYQRVLDQKAAALKGARPEPAMLDALDVQLAEQAARLVERRMDLLTDLRAHIEALHRRIAGDAGMRVTLRYRSPVVEAQGTMAERWRRIFERSRQGELRRRICLSGPQRDDVEILLDGQPVRSFGSRGQVRSVVLSLKLAELVAARARGDAPLFLLDDLSSELDRARTQRLVEVLSELAAQVFITTTDRGHLGALPADVTCSLRVSQGEVTSSA